MFCEYIPPLAVLIPQQRTDVGPPNKREAYPDLLTAKRVGKRIPANSSPANMAANPPNTRIPPRPLTDLSGVGRR
jgi:hypothetical protein